MLRFDRGKILKSTGAGLALAILAGFSVSLQSESPQSTQVPVFVVLRGADRQKIDQIASCPSVSGITLYYGWSGLEPKPGVYDFSQVIADVDKVIAHGKKVNVALLPGQWSPEFTLSNIPNLQWVQNDTNVGNNMGVHSKAPVPWNPEFQSEFSSAIDAFGKALSGKKLNSIAITGGSNTNGIEMNLHATNAEMEKAGFSQEKYIHAWEHFVDEYAKAFPDQMLTLAVHNQIGDSRNQEIPNQILDYARQQLGHRFFPTSFAFTGASWFKGGDPYVDLLLNHRDGGNFGLQALQIYSTKNDRAGFQQMIQKANQFQPAWLEIWPNDLQAGYWPCN